MGRSELALGFVSSIHMVDAGSSLNHVESLVLVREDLLRFSIPGRVRLGTRNMSSCKTDIVGNGMISIGKGGDAYITWIEKFMARAQCEYICTPLCLVGPADTYRPCGLVTSIALRLEAMKISSSCLIGEKKAYHTPPHAPHSQKKRKEKENASCSQPFPITVAIDEDYLVTAHQRRHHLSPPFRVLVSVSLSSVRRPRRTFLEFSLPLLCRLMMSRIWPFWN